MSKASECATGTREMMAAAQKGRALPEERSVLPTLVSELRL